MTTQSDFSEADLNKELDGDIDSLVDNFGRIIQSGFVRNRDSNNTVLEPKTKLQLAHEDHVIMDSASNIIVTVESMLRFTGEMKKALLNKDYRLLNTYAALQAEKIEAAKDVCADAFVQLQDEISVATRHVEDVLAETSAVVE